MHKFAKLVVVVIDVLAFATTGKLDATAPPQSATEGGPAFGKEKDAARPNLLIVGASSLNSSVGQTQLVWAEETASKRVVTDDAAAKYRQSIVNAVALLDGKNAKPEHSASCINCHHAPLRGWALREAARAGVPVDLAALENATSSQLEKLSEFNDDYRNKQWGHSLATFYMVGNLDDVSPTLSVDARSKLVEVITAEQSADGSWKAAQQFANQRRPKRDGIRSRPCGVC